jgi:conjugal transfer pilin signal peptidase TrbI
MKQSVWNNRNIAWLGTSLARHLRKWWLFWIVPISLYVAAASLLKIGINATESLPQRVFLVKKYDRDKFQRGDLVSFVWHGGIYPKGLDFVKIVAGVPGDTVTIDGRKIYINGALVAVAKERSKKGLPLEVGPSGVIPPGRLFVLTNHPDSLDSRYAITGWINTQAVIGKAIPLL